MLPKDKASCYGCGACAQRCPRQCIAMQEDNEGFLYPVINRDKCICCGLCAEVCPSLQKPPGRPGELLVYACRSTDTEILKWSSSGGVFTHLAQAVIERDGIVFGAAFGHDLSVAHAYAESPRDVARFRGSKYVQSTIGDTYGAAERMLEQGKPVLFSGTPCQIAGLKAFLRRDYPNLLTVALVCHGVPSPKVLRLYLAEHAERHRCTLVGVSFRDKTNGWSSRSIRFDYTRSGTPATIVEPTADNAFMRGFLRGLYLRPSCHRCAFKSLLSGADLTIGDYWRVGEAHPELDDDRGVSLAIVASEKGETALMACANRMRFLLSTYENASRGNPSLNRSVAAHRNRRRFFDGLAEGSVEALIRDCMKTSRSRKLAHSLKRRLAALRSPLHR